MNICKIAETAAKGKPMSVYDHYVGVDWSIRTMAIAHMSRRDQNSWDL